MIWLDRFNITGQRNADTSWASQNRANTQMVEVKKAHLRLRVEGSGKYTMIVLADPPNVIEHYDRFFEVLSKDFKVVVCEHPGEGFSVHKSSFCFSSSEHTEAIEEMILKMNFQNIVLVLPCVSAYIGLPLAQKHPQLIHSVILLQAPSWTEQKKWVKRIDPKNLLRTPFVGQFALASIKRKKQVAAIWYKIALADRNVFQDFFSKASEEFEHKGCYCLASMLQKMMQEKPTFQPITQPTLIIWGLKDKSHLPTDKKTTLAFATNPTYLEWEDAGHFPELEQVDKFRIAVMEWIAD